MAVSITIPVSDWNKLNRLVRQIADRVGVSNEDKKVWVSVRSLTKTTGFTYNQVRARRNNTNSMKDGARWKYDLTEFKKMTA